MRREDRPVAVACLDQPALLREVFYADWEEAADSTCVAQLSSRFVSDVDWTRIEA